MKRLLPILLVFAACATKQQSNVATTTTTASSNPYTLSADTTPVGVIPAATLHDPQRNKDIEMSIDYPTKGGPFPVVIFSPNYGGSRAGYVGLSAYWAGHGYVVIKPSHADAGVLRDVLQKRADERRAEMEAQQSQGRSRRRQPVTSPQPREFRPDPTEVWTGQTPADWKNRAADITFIIDSLPRLIEQYPEIKERVDTTRIGVGGHSYGAFTALLIGGVATSYADPRVKAIEAMSPPGPSPERGLTNESFSTIKVPVLFLTGTRDNGATESENTAWRKRAFELSPPPDKLFVAVQGAGPASFTGQMADFGFPGERPPDYPYPTSRPPIGGNYPQQQPPPMDRRTSILPGVSGTATVRTISLAFWDAYLKDDKAGREFLANLKNRGDLQVETK